MTLTAAPPQPVAVAPAEPGSGRGPTTALIVGSALTLFAVCLLSFFFQVTVLSQVKYDRTQQVLYANYRSDLANALAPTGQTSEDGRLLAPGTAVAVLRIPALGLRQVVVEGTSGGDLTAGPGHRRDTVMPGQAGTSVLMGRRSAYGGPFGNVDTLSTGDLIYVVTGQGEHTYRVLGVRHTGDPVPKSPAAGAGRLTLITGAGQPFFPTDVLHVDADLVTPVQATGPRPLRAASLPAGEKAMASDETAWVPLLLWGQALLIVAFAVSWARIRWGRWQAWIVGVPMLAVIGSTVADHAVQLLPNLL